MEVNFKHIHVGGGVGRLDGSQGKGHGVRVRDFHNHRGINHHFIYSRDRRQGFNVRGFRRIERVRRMGIRGSKGGGRGRGAVEGEGESMTQDLREGG